jgi:ABC-type transporter MlaC component
MKQAFLYLTFMLLATTYAFSQTTKDSSWIEQFRTFRDALYHRDKATVKQFFDFPVKNTSIWSLAQMGVATDDKATENAIGKLWKSETPLTEKLFDLYFDQIFIKDFTSCLLKIKTKELYEKGEAETPALSDDKIYFHTLNAKFDTGEKMLALNLRLYADTKLTDEDYGEGAVLIFYFRVIKGKLKFTDLFMAG